MSSAAMPPPPDAVVLLCNSRQEPIGTGFFIGPRKVLTCAHVVHNLVDGPVEVLWRGRKFQARVIALEPAEPAPGAALYPPPDLALLELPSDSLEAHPVIKMSEHDSVPGDTLIVYGFSRIYSEAPELWSGQYVVDGTTGALTRIRGGEVPPGLAGGPALDPATGRLVGMVKATDRRTGAGLINPVRTIRQFLDRVAPSIDSPRLAEPSDDHREIPAPAIQELAVVGTRGFPDGPAAEDQLGRAAIVDVLVDLLSPPPDRTGTLRTNDTAREHLDEEAPRWPPEHIGPRVIAIDGPWGSGKTTVMRLVHDRLHSAHQSWRTEHRRGLTRRQRWAEWRRSRRLTALGAHRMLSVWRRADADWTERAEGERIPIAHRSPAVARFEPWAHQSSEQVWAALTKVITRAAVGAICGSHGAARRFWFARNAERLDISRLRRQLWRGVASPLLRISAFAAAVPVVVQLIRPETKVRVWGLTPTTLAWLLPVLLLAVGLLHTAGRYLFGRASTFLPEELFEGPVLSGGLAVATPDPALRDPLYHAQSGSLYLVQHDVALVLRYLRESGHELVVFVDDLDRCTPKNSTEVLQAINLFLSGNLTGCRFVVGLDQVAVAAQVNEAYSHMTSAQSLCHGDDPTPGWSFLRKLVQLPITLPRIADTHLENFLASLLEDDQPRSTAEVNRPASALATSAAPPDRGQPAPPTQPRPDVETVTIQRQYLERNADVRKTLLERIKAAPDPSGRETKRLVTIWQFYVRVLLIADPATDITGRAAQARRLVVVAEIVARWPALARELRTVIDGRYGIYRLAEAADDYLQWCRTASQLKLHTAGNRDALEHLRDLLSGRDGKEAAELFERIDLRIANP